MTVIVISVRDDGSDRKRETERERDNEEKERERMRRERRRGRGWSNNLMPGRVEINCMVIFFPV